MGREQGPDFYDGVYRSNAAYSCPATESPWAHLHRWAVSRVRNDHVVDIGCGVGHIAELLSAEGHDPQRYIGVDFSHTAIDMARERVPGFRFEVAVAMEFARSVKRWPGATAVVCEVLEHIRADKSLLRRLPVGTRVLATVPSHDSAGHVRHFPTLASVAARYEAVLLISSIERLGRCYGIEGVTIARSR